MWKRNQLLAAAFFSLLLVVQPTVGKPPALGTGELIAELKSDFSHIRVRKQGSFVSLNFVHDSGREAVETVVNLRQPHQLLVPYTRSMFASYLFQPEPKRVLVVGLGGGAMVHFLRHYDPLVEVDAIDIDTAVVKIAAKHFGCTSDKRTNIQTADGFKFLREGDRQYDVIYMDAFLKPSEQTDATGAPKRLKTIEFYQQVQTRLNPGGVVVFNLNVHRDLKADANTLSKAFAKTYTFRVGRANLVVVGTPAGKTFSANELRTQGQKVDLRLKASFSLRQLVSQMGR